MSFQTQTNDETEKDKELSMNDILRTETAQNKQQPWSRLNKTDKIAKLNSYVAGLTEQHELGSDEIIALKRYLLTSLERKRLVTVKDVTYDAEVGEISAIPLLTFNEERRCFALQRSASRSSTLSSLSKPKN